MRLIDADHLISIIKEYIKREDSYISICNNPILAKGIKRGLQEAARTVKKEPTAQPEVIRCKDCKYWREGGMYSYCQKLFNCAVLDVYDYMRTEDDYCSYADRRTNG